MFIFALQKNSQTMDKNTDKTKYKVTVSSGLSAEEILSGYLKRNPEGMRGAVKGFLSDRRGQGGYIYGSAASLAEAAAVLLTYGFERIDSGSADKKIAETELGLDLLQCDSSEDIKEASVCCTAYRTGDGEYKAVFTEGDFRIILDSGTGYKIEGKLKCGPEMLEGFSGEVTQYYDKHMRGRICRGGLHSPETIIIDNL